MLPPSLDARLFTMLARSARETRSAVIAAGCAADHVHVLVKLRPDKALADVLRDLKAHATGWLHNVFPALSDFTWQRGYGAFTVSQSNVSAVQQYIARQPEHHQRKSAREELIEFLRANGCEFDERYL